MAPSCRLLFSGIFPNTQLMLLSNFARKYGPVQIAVKLKSANGSERLAIVEFFRQSNAISAKTALKKAKYNFEVDYASIPTTGPFGSDWSLDESLNPCMASGKQANECCPHCQLLYCSAVCRESVRVAHQLICPPTTALEETTAEPVAATSAVSGGMQQRPRTPLTKPRPLGKLVFL